MRRAPPDAGRGRRGDPAPGAVDLLDTGTFTFAATPLWCGHEGSGIGRESRGYVFVSYGRVGYAGVREHLHHRPTEPARRAPAGDAGRAVAPAPRSPRPRSPRGRRAWRPQGRRGP